MLMQIAVELRSLSAVAAYLPFHLDDTDRANAAFERWRRAGNDDAKQVVDIWTYCFVRRYFLTKCAREAEWQVSDMDALVAEAFSKIEAKSGTVAASGHYASWVSVLCKHTFINHIRVRWRVVPLHETTASRLTAEMHIVDGEAAVLKQALNAAVSRLPDFLQDVARLRFIEKRSYEEIGRETGRPLPVVRSYVSKAVTRFRRDPHLLALRDHVFECEP